MLVSMYIEGPDSSQLQGFLASMIVYYPVVVWSILQGVL